MEFIIDKRVFFKGLQRVQGVSDTKGAIPILSYILIEAVDNSVWIFATDLKIGIKGSLPADVKSEGRVTLPSKKIFDIVRELPDGDVHISVNTSLPQTGRDQWVNLQAGKYKSKIPSLSPEIFPEFPSYDDECLVSFRPDILKSMIKKTILSISHEEARPVLTGALIEIENDSIIFVSTDGHRLTYVKTENKKPVEKKIKLILPQKTCSELIKFIEKMDEEILFGTSNSQAVFRQGDLVLVSRLIEEGQYPRYEGVIPEQKGEPVIIRKDNFIDSLKRVSVLAEEDSGLVRLDVGENIVEITADSAERGAAHEILPAKCNASQLFIGLNARYLIEFLSVIDDDQIILFIKGPKNPALLMPQNNEDHKSVIMPMRLNTQEDDDSAEATDEE